MRALAIVLALIACGGPSKPAAGPAISAGAVPLLGLEAASFGDSADQIVAAFPGAYSEGALVWLEHGHVESLPAVIEFGFTDGTLHTITVAFDTPCSLLDDLEAQLDDRLGKRTSAEAGIAAWSHAGWDLALYCAHGDAGEFPRLDVRPTAVL